MSTLKVGTIQDHANGNTAISIDSSGRVTTPARPSFEAKRTSGDVTQGNVVVWNETRHNIGGHYNTSTGEFTAPIGGTYLFTGQGFTNNTNNITLDLQVNGVNRFRYQDVTDTNGYRSGTFSYITLLNTSDVVRIYTTIGTVHINPSGLYSHFAGVLIG